MERQYYFSIQFEPENADNELLAGRCIAVMHGFMSNARNQHFRHTVGIAFPKWDRNTVGNVVCFFSQHKDILTGLSFQSYLSTMVNEEIFVLSDIQEVPATSDRVRFVRNRTIGKSFIGSKKRRVDRVLRRAGERNEIHLPVFLEQREFDFFHSIPIMSHSSGQEFVLHIQREMQEDDTFQQGFDSYGFASNSKWRGSVPNV